MRPSYDEYVRMIIPLIVSTSRKNNFTRVVLAMRVCVFMGCFLLAPVSFASKDPEQWLMDMSDNSAQLNYSGNLVYIQGSRMDTMRIYHAIKEGVQHERLVHMSGQHREFIRRGSSVVYIDAVNGMTSLDAQAGGAGDYFSESDFSSGYSARFAALREPYEVSFDGHDRVAGRAVALITLMPKDNYRHGFQLALDKSTKLLLRSLMMDADRTVLERFEYTQIDIGTEIADADLAPEVLKKQASKPLEQDQKKPRAQSRQHASSASWHVGWVPPAFTLASDDRVLGPDPGHDRPLMYSDGLTAFSVFVEDNADLGQHSRRRGATMAHTLAKEDRKGLFSVTVVGEIPLVAAEKIANSVTRAKVK
ncbi:MAG: MucB/RseB C-terminal domain-containing protein [Pseudomonadales bacterium]|nr:MucB/RseB C-terminal domain-containing protein [Pseudomonadales bacterium]